MFINARPRIVSHGFESFVYAQRAESLHQRLVEMTNNDINAWGFYRPVGSSTTGDWDQNLEDFNNENFQARDVYTGYYQDTSFASQAQATNLPKASLYTAGQQSLYQPQKTISTSNSIYQQPTSQINSSEKPSPMLANGYSLWNLGRRDSFAEYWNSREATKDILYQNTGESDLVPFASALSIAPASSYQEGVSVMTDFNIGKTCSGIAYSSYSSAPTVDPQPLADVNPFNSHDGIPKDAWWVEGTRGNKGLHQDAHDMTWIHGRLSKTQDQQQQQCFDLWNGGYNQSSEWTLPSTESTAISPKALTLNVSSATISSSESSQGFALSLSDSCSASSSRDTPELGPEILSVVEPQAPSRRPHRQILPDSNPSYLDIVPVLPSNDQTSTKTIKKISPKSSPKSRSYPRTSRSFNSTSMASPKISHMVEPARQRSSVPKRIEPKPRHDPEQQFWANSTPASAETQAKHHRDAKDDFLVRSKLAGMSYKDIRRQGNFTEAESTLRGRFRTLTKAKTARVRKPEWDDNDMRLLKRAVRKLHNGSDPLKNKVPWKQVAEYIANNGGSYHFGNATCRKRWDELQAQEQKA